MKRDVADDSDGEGDMFYEGEGAEFQLMHDYERPSGSRREITEVDTNTAAEDEALEEAVSAVMVFGAEKAETTEMLEEASTEDAETTVPAVSVADAVTLIDREAIGAVTVVGGV